MEGHTASFLKEPSSQAMSLQYVAPVRELWPLRSLQFTESRALFDLGDEALNRLGSHQPVWTPAPPALRPSIHLSTPDRCSF